MQLTRLGPYEIGKPLGKGGMGSVYEATNVETGQRVAVKALTPHLAMAEGFRERFEAEIESLKALRHEGIVRLYGYGEQDGVLFYSMELVEGVSLEDELKAGRRFNWREVTSITIQLSLALKHAHDHGIVHRDIKPANVLLYDDGKVKLADFGIARLFGMNQLTTAGGVLGTADYMSPEQADGRPVTARCDQYSLGSVMYALLAGRPPFRASNLPQMLQLQRYAQAEPIRRYAPDVPEQLELVIAQLLAKEPADRFPNMQVLARHLQAMVNALSRPTADDFALANEEPGGGRAEAGWDRSVSLGTTHAEADVARKRRDAALPAAEALRESKAVGPNWTPDVASPQDAATLAADEMASSENRPPDDRASARPQAAVATVVKERPSRFTTVEEEEARQKALQQRSWLQLAGQLAVLGAVLVGMGGVAYYMSRPPTADELFRAVTSRAELDDPESLGEVEREVDEFLKLYPDDPRAADMRRFQEEIALDKMERKLRRAGGGADPSLLPIEQLYVQAINAAQASPESAVRMLESLVDLYPPAAPLKIANHRPAAAQKAGVDDDAEARAAAIVQLAQRRLTTLRAELEKHSEQQRAALQERLDAAERVAKTAPKEGAAMYRAIIELFGKSDWAQHLVEEARRRLRELE